MRAQVHFVDQQPPVVDAWSYQFEDVEVKPQIACGDIFETAADALVIAGNSFGFLDRGIELTLCERYGFELQDVLRETVREKFRGELLIGQAASVPLPGGAQQKQLIYVSQYRTPAPVEGTVNPYLACRGAFLEIERQEEGGSEAPGSVALAGVGSGGCGLHPGLVARQMRYAFEIFRTGRGYGDKNLSQLSRRQSKLASIPKSYLEGENAPSASESP